MFQFIIKYPINILNNNMVYFILHIRTLISIFLSVRGTVENVDEFVRRMKAIKIGLVCVYFERGNNLIL